jgi:CubicO group peptidase (beta-lactamase class C family)
MKIAFVFAVALALRAAPVVNPSKAGMDPDRLARIPPRMKAFVEKGTIPGAVTLVSRHGAVACLDAVGYQDLETKKPMRTDTIFRIASMTKPITSVGIMILMEAGRLALSDPVENHLPDFKGMWVIESRDGDKTRTLARPSRPLTIRDLMTHTSGMYGMPPETLEDALGRARKTVAEVVALASQQPIDFDPGSKWQYSNLGIATLGRIIEVVSDQPYEKFMEARILQPLGMKDSFFFLPDDRLDRLAAIYTMEKGKLKKNEQERDRKTQKYPFPEGGLQSTAADLAAFYQMMLNGGTYNGKRILSKASMEVMTAVHTGALKAAGPGMGWGLGWSVVRDAMGTLPLTSLGAFGHGGIYGTHGWIDPKKDLFGIFLVQRPGASDERNAFMELAASAIVD